MAAPQNRPGHGSSAAVRRRWPGPLLVVVAIGLVYANSLGTPFLFDDAGAVGGNPTIRRLASLEVLRPPSDGSTTTGRPLVNLSFALNYALGGEKVWSYHALNLVLHATGALLLFGLVRRTLWMIGCQVPAGRADALALGVALVWALHPLQTESVVCVAQRTEVLCGVCYLLTLYAFVRATLGDRSSAGKWFTVSVGACLAGMAAKEVMVSAPLLVLFFDRTFVAGSFSGAWRARRGFYLALAATWLLLAALLVSSAGARGVSAGFGLGVSTWSYLLTQCEALTLYLRLAVWPHPLVLDYGSALVGSLDAVWCQASVVLAMLGATVWALARRPRLGFLGASFFLILAPSSSFVPLVTQTMAEHRMYLPLAALAAGAVLGCGLRWPGATKRVWPLAALALAVTTFARNRDYRDALTIWSVTVADYPASARAHHNLALVLHEAGRTAEAHRHFARAVEIDPGYVAAFSNWGVALLSERRFDEAIERFERGLALAPRNADSAAKLAPALAEAYVELGRLLERQRRPAEAEARYRAALKLAPENAAAHARLGVLLARAERLDDATLHLREAVKLAPLDADAHANLGNVLLLQGRARDAAEHYEAALRLRPDDPRLRESLDAARGAFR